MGGFFVYLWRDDILTDEQKKAVSELRGQGCGYKKIGQTLGISENTVKAFCKRSGLGGTTKGARQKNNVCVYCGAHVTQIPGRKEKRFCSDACRNRWWNSHLSQVNRRAFYSFTCPECGKVFESYGNQHRKYCSRDCASRARRIAHDN